MDDERLKNSGGWEWLVTKGATTSSEYETALGVSNRNALNHLNKFIGFGLVRRVGFGPSTEYQVVV